jgi:hypothetical protein
MDKVVGVGLLSRLTPVGIALGAGTGVAVGKIVGVGTAVAVGTASAVAVGNEETGGLRRGEEAQATSRTTLPTIMRDEKSHRPARKHTGTSPSLNEGDGTTPGRRAQ